MMMKYNFIMQQIIDIRLKMEELANKGLIKEYQLQKEKRDRLIALLGFLLLMYSDDNFIINMTKAEKTREMRKLEQLLRKIHQELSEYESRNMYNTLQKAYKDTYYRVAHLLDTSSIAGVKYSKIIRDSYIDEIIKGHKIDNLNCIDRVQKNNQWLIDKIYNTVGKAVYDNKDIKVVKDNIKDIFDSKAYMSKRLTHDQLSRIATNAMMAMYIDSEIIQKVVWVSVLEENTCSECEMLHGTVYDVDNVEEEPPLHANCKCMLLPWETEVKFIKKKVITYEDWLEEEDIYID